MRNRDIVNEVITMHKLIHAYQLTEIEKLAREVNDLKDQISNMNMQSTKFYSLGAISTASKIAMSDPDRRYPMKIQAIKVVRETYGYNLKESKELVDAVCEGYKILFPEQS